MGVKPNKTCRVRSGWEQNTNGQPIAVVLVEGGARDARNNGILTRPAPQKGDNPPWADCPGLKAVPA